MSQKDTKGEGTRWGKRLATLKRSVLGVKKKKKDKENACGQTGTSGSLLVPARGFQVETQLVKLWAGQREERWGEERATNEKRKKEK